MRYKHKNGRTMREAINAGDSYRLQFNSGGDYWPIGCAGLNEVLHAARQVFPNRIGQVVEAHLVYAGSIGCLFVQDAGQHTL